MELLEAFGKFLGNILIKVGIYLAASFVIFLISFSVFTKKFPPDFKLLMTGYKNLSAAMQALKENRAMLDMMLKQDLSAQLQQSQQLMQATQSASATNDSLSNAAPPTTGTADPIAGMDKDIMNKAMEDAINSGADANAVQHAMNLITRSQELQREVDRLRQENEELRRQLGR